MEVKSVYNFVPAPKESEVFKPDWADQVSHDLPFSDGESGEIEIKITAETPIFIRNGHSKDNESNEFSHYVIDGKKKYFIPATSLKGMFRNVLEIITASKLNPDLVNNDRYSFRDLTPGSLYMKNYKSNKVQAGWLTQKEDGKWEIKKCKSFYLIHHTEVDKALGTNFRKMFLNQNPEETTAVYKYNQVINGLDITYKVLTDEEGKERAVRDANGNLKGRIVLTGQASKRVEPDGPKKKAFGKVHEFVFSQEEDEEIGITEAQQKDFKFIYLEGDSKNISKDWAYWKEKLLRREKVPVFFTQDSNGQLLHFGLAFMYKLPYKHNIHEMNPIKTYSSKRDLSTTLFGDIHKDDSLRGRVMFGHACSDNAEPYDELMIEILAGPKASFYPFYIEQRNVTASGYATYLKDGTIRGYKRYPVHQTIRNGSYSPKQLQNKDVFSYFRPLKEGAKFHFVVRFHNLRKMEIGALLSAITFHNNSRSYFHSLGGAKPLGCGKISVSDPKLIGLKYNLLDYLLEFENKIGSQELKNRLTNLLAMAGWKNDSSLQYPILDMDNKINEFTDYKKSEQFLLDPSKLNPVKFELVNEFIARKEEEKKQDEQKLRAKEIQEQQEKEAEILTFSNDIDRLRKFVNNYPYNENTKMFEERIQELSHEKKKKEAEELSNKFSPNFKDNKFKTIQEECKAPYKVNKYFEFSNEAKDHIENQIRKCWKDDPNIFRKKNELIAFPKFPWSDIVKWLGEERAKSLYNDLTSQ